MIFKGKKVLTIDDARSIRVFLRISMESMGAKVFEAHTAEEGLVICKQEKPDLVVLDLGLPDRDGLSILPEIKQIENAPRVIVLTVRNENEIKEKAAQLGADAYLTKPFMVEDLLDSIEKHIA